MTASLAKIGGVSDYFHVRAFDALGRVTTAYHGGSGGHAVSEKRVDFTYNAAGQPTSTMRYASFTTASPVALTQQSYDEHGRLIYIDHLGIAPGSTFGEAHGYDYDDANRLTRYTNLIDGILADYDYDNRGQLTAADHFNDIYDESYGYDDNGNRESENGAAYDIDPNNRIYHDDTYLYQYDDEGNVTRREPVGGRTYTEYTWDHRNRLIRVTQGDESQVTSDIEYKYDAFNQLIGRTSTSDGVVLTSTAFAYEDGQVVLQFHKLGTGDLTANDLSNRYLWGPAVDQLLADEQVSELFTAANNETLWALTDHLGSVRDVVDSNGDLRIHRNFDAFGNIVDETHYDANGAVVTGGQAGYVDEAFAFTGRYFDKSTGLQNNLHRWYDPNVGRWLSEDPIGFAAGDPNLYRYVGNSPTMHTDPTGEIPPLIIIGIGIGAFFGAMSSANVANAPAPGDPVFPDTGPGGGEPENVLIGAGVGGAVAGAARGISGIVGRGAATSTKFVGMTNNQIVKSIGGDQLKLLKGWMGTGPAGARNAIGKPLPKGLTKYSLRAYREIAVRQIKANNDPIGTQAERLKLINQALTKLGG
jgi:RHS repeat-associated protein